MMTKSKLYAAVAEKTGLKRAQVTATLEALAEVAIANAREGVVIAIDGTAVPVAARTLCIHGDSPGAATIAAAVRQALEDAGVVIAPLRVNGEQR